MASIENFPPVFYGNMGPIEQAVVMLNSVELANAMKSQNPVMAMNVGMLLIVMALVTSQTSEPDKVVNEIADCAVRSLVSFRARSREAKEEMQ